MTSVEAITNILNEQVNSYKMLLDLLQRERACLLDFNAEGVEELSKEKDTLVLRLRLLEEERIRLMRKFSDETIHATSCTKDDENNPPLVKGGEEGFEKVSSNKRGFVGDMSLQRLWELTGDNTFQDMRSKLISLLQSIEELNEFNRLLIERSLGYIKSTANFFGSFGLSCNPKGKGALLSRET